MRFWRDEIEQETEKLEVFYSKLSPQKMVTHQEEQSLLEDRRGLFLEENTSWVVFGGENQHFMMKAWSNGCFNTFLSLLQETSSSPFNEKHTPTTENTQSHSSPFESVPGLAAISTQAVPQMIKGRPDCADRREPDPLNNSD